MADEQDNNEEEVLAAASDAIESAQANIQIEVYFNRLARVGNMLRVWKYMMMEPPKEGEMGYPFNEEWVDHACMTVFHEFYPHPHESEEYDNDD